MVEGNFKIDTAVSISGAKLTAHGNLVLRVDWNIRKNGIIPASTYVSKTILRLKCPQLLLDFYEARLVFPPKPSTSREAITDNSEI